MVRVHNGPGVNIVWSTVVAGLNLKNGHTKSCGCTQVVGKVTHGLARHPLYGIWKGMWARCTNPEAARYSRYGGRGIEVCDRWKDIYLWLQDMGPRPKGYQIERKDNDGDYTPSNCRWGTQSEQANNKSNNVFITYKEETHTMAQWSRITGISPGNLQKRYVQLGWSAARTLDEEKR